MINVSIIGDTPEKHVVFYWLFIWTTLHFLMLLAHLGIGEKIDTLKVQEI